MGAFLDTLNSALMSIGDPALGWLLNLPRSVALFIIAIGTALILTVVRLWTTNQDLLGRCKRDKARLKQLMKEAKKAGDKEAVARYRTTVGQIGMKTMKAEGKPLLASIVPIAIIACWAWARIAYEAPVPGEPMDVYVYYEAAAIGRLTHLVPQENLEAETGWIQKVVQDVDRDGKPINSGVARWRLRAAQKNDPYLLEFRYDGRTFTKEFIVDGRKYAEPITFYEEGAPALCTELKLTEAKLFGVIPGLPWIGMQAWMVGYLVIVLPFSFLLKPLLRIN
ncbi:MAG TPA: EMC3/TMCO1 family protein [Phycisphaerae bacterium]|nr:EMC3/TMCO1 family protein [Phycisphaerae bacterium]